MLVLSIIFAKCGSNVEKLFRQEESIEILKIIDLINKIEDCQMSSR